jgi:hypothetical protein
MVLENKAHCSFLEGKKIPSSPWRPDELGFFDPGLENDTVVGKGDIVCLGNHPHYRNHQYVRVRRQNQRHCTGKLIPDSISGASIAAWRPRTLTWPSPLWKG